MRWNGLPTVIFGTGGISREAAFLIAKINSYSNVPVYDLLGFVSKNECEINGMIEGVKIVTSDSNFHDYALKFPSLGVVLAFGAPILKRVLYDKLSDIGNLVFPNLIHPNVDFDKSSINLGVGNMIDSGAILAINSKVDSFNLIHFNSTIGHDAKIQNFCVINPQVKISGNVTVEDEVLIGTGATILQGLTIGSNAIVGAGAVVVKNVDRLSTVVGVPARPIVEKKEINNLL